MNSLRFALRQLLKNPGFTVVAALMLSLGIGANTALFSVIHAVVLRPLPYQEADRIVQVWGTRPAASHFRARTSLPNFLDFKEQNTAFADLAYYRMADFHFTGTENPAEVRVGRVSDEFFDVLKVPPALGRVFLPEENVPGKGDVVVLSHGLWAGRFGSDSGIVGKSIGLEGKSYLVCGVMPPGFQFPERAELWIPFAPASAPGVHKRTDHFYLVIGRLKEGRALAEAQTEMQAIAARLEKTFPEANDGAGCVLVPLPQELVGDFKPALLLLLGAVAAVLLIACANVANLQLIRGLARQKEIAVRSAVGATRAQLVRQLLVESVVLAILGGSIGVGLAFVGLRGILAIAPADVPRLAETQLDGAVLMASLALSTLTGILFGVVPALIASKPDLVHHLKQGGKSATDGRPRAHARHWLVVGEVAAAATLLVTAGLLAQSFWKVTTASLGFNPSDLGTVRVTLPWNQYHGEARERRFFKRLLERLQSHPGAEDTALVCALPIADRQTTVWFKELGMPYQPGREPTAGFNYVTPSYLGVMKIPLLRGRNLDDHDVQDAPRVVVVDESLANRFFAGVDPIGKRLLIEGQGDEPFQVIGVAGAVAQRGVLRGSMPQLYLHYQQINECSMWVVTRGANKLRGFERTVAAEVRALDADQSTGPYRTMEQHLGEYGRLARFRTLLTEVMAALALFLSIIGVYSVVAFSATQRTRELGLRIALGASRRDILRLILVSGSRIAITGVILGILLALGTAGLLNDMLFGVTPYDVWTLGGISGLLLGACVVASYLPARRAAKVDPMAALRSE